MDQLLPLTTFEVIEPDFSAADMAAETTRYFQRQRAIARCLDGQEAPDVVLDLLESQGLDPVEYVAAVEQNVELVIMQALPVEAWV